MKRWMAYAAEVGGGLVASVFSVYGALWMLKYRPWQKPVYTVDDPNYVPTWFDLHLSSIFFVSFLGSLVIGLLGGVILTRIFLRSTKSLPKT